MTDFFDDAPATSALSPPPVSPPSERQGLPPSKVPGLHFLPVHTSLLENPPPELLMLMEKMDNCLITAGLRPPTPLIPETPEPQPLPPVDDTPTSRPVRGITRRGTPRIRRRDVKWRHAAVMLARGVGVTAVAQEYDVCESVILRNLARSARFRDWVREAEAAVEADAARHAAWLRLRAASRLADRAEREDPKTLDPLVRPIAELTRERVGEARSAADAVPVARLSGFTRKDFR